MLWFLGGYMWLFIHRPFEVWPALGELHIERIYMIATIACWLLVGRKSWVRNPLNAAFGFFALAMVTSFLLSPHKEYGQVLVEDWLKIAVFYVLCMSVVRDERDLKQLIVMYLGAFALYMMHSLWEYRNGRYQWTMGTARLLGVDLNGGDPNTFAASIIYSLTLAMMLWPYVRQKWHRAALGGYIALAAVSVLLTSSRTSFVGLCVLTLVAATLSKHRLKWAFLLAITAPVIWHFLPPDRQNRFLTLIDPSYGPANALESAEGRTKGWQDGVRLWKENPVFGLGPGGFLPAAGRKLESHHLYGQVLSEMGSVGAAALMAILAAFASNALWAYRACRAWPEHRHGFAVRIVWGTSLAVVLLLLLGFGGHNLYRYNWLWFGAFQGLAIHCMKRAQDAWEVEEGLTLDDEHEPREAAFV